MTPGKINYDPQEDHASCECGGVVATAGGDVSLQRYRCRQCGASGQFERSSEKYADLPPGDGKLPPSRVTPETMEQLKRSQREHQQRKPE